VGNYWAQKFGWVPVGYFACVANYDVVVSVWGLMQGSMRKPKARASRTSGSLRGEWYDAITLSLCSALLFYSDQCTPFLI
jgi:hypothetical protein